MYDERGRPVNPETKRINKDVVRSHNEVMLVIGVAEPENGGALDAQIEARLIQHENEDRIGRRLRNVGRVLQLGGIWGLYGLRQRILVGRRSYKYMYFLLLTIFSSTGNIRISTSTSYFNTSAVSIPSRVCFWPGFPRLSSGMLSNGCPPCTGSAASGNGMSTGHPFVARLTRGHAGLSRESNM